MCKMPKESTKSSQGRTPRVLDLLVRLVLVITLPLPITLCCALMPGAASSYLEL